MCFICFKTINLCSFILDFYSVINEHIVALQYHLRLCLLCLQLLDVRALLSIQLFANSGGSRGSPAMAPSSLLNVE